MKRETIIQFVCFESAADTDEFITQWEQYNKQVSSPRVATLQQDAGYKNRFRYVSQHKCFAEDFHFLFKKERRSPHSPETGMRVREIGGYSPLQMECKHDSEDDEVKIMVFISSPSADIESFRELADYHFLNIYEAYYESCVYDYVLEYFVKEILADNLLTQLKDYNHLSEMGVYKECLVMEK